MYNRGKKDKSVAQIASNSSFSFTCDDVADNSSPPAKRNLRNKTAYIYQNDSSDGDKEEGQSVNPSSNNSKVYRKRTTINMSKGDEQLLDLSSKCEADREALTKTLLEYKNTNLNIRGKNGFTPLHLASQCGNLCTCNLLIEFGANVDIQSTDGSTPLYIASLKGHIDICKVLLENGANCELGLYKKGNWNPLTVVVNKGNYEMAKLLLDVGNAEVNCLIARNYTPLLISAAQGNLEMFKLLLSKGANPKMTDSDGIGFAKKVGRLKHVEFLDYISTPEYCRFVENFKV
jgi:ankyrin repeat protein